MNIEWSPSVLFALDLMPRQRPELINLSNAPYILKKKDFIGDMKRIAWQRMMMYLDNFKRP